MGLLDQLWDDTVAGPRPDIGLGKLRKHKTFSFRSSSAKGSSDGGNVGSYGEDSTEEATRVTRSIMIVKPPGYGSGNSGSPPISPAGSTPPVSPFSGKHLECHMYPWLTVYYGGAKSPQMVEPALKLTGCSETRGGSSMGRFRRRSASDTYEKASQVGGGGARSSPRSPFDV